MNQNELMSKKEKKVCTVLSYAAHFLILAFVVTGYASISALASLVVISVEIMSSEVGIKICSICAGIKK